jgi:uncharacterized protein (TIGR03435 family)
MRKRILLTVLAAASLPAQIPLFDVVSIKPCKVDVSGGVRVGGNKTSPGRLTMTCVPLRMLIQHAYLIYAEGRYKDFNWYDVPIEGAPGWTQSERYTIEATAPGLPSEGIMNGPMLQALLEDRFKLKIRRETREVPVYELVVAKGGPKLKPFDGSCTPVDWDKATLEPGDCRNEAGASGPNMTRFWHSITIDDFTMAVLDKQFTGRSVVNKTGIAGVFDIHLEFTPERDSAAADAGPSIFTAVQEQLGLRLVPARGPEEFLIIESVERPSEN